MKPDELTTATTSTTGWSPDNITYCSNVHAGENLDDILRNLDQFNQAVRQQRGLNAMTSGLWLSAIAAETLKDPDQLIRFKHRLSATNINLTSINGFPFGNFHDEQVKEKVYLPDWSDTARLNYTKNLADILANCLPENTTLGAISTLPLGYKLFWNKNKQTAANKNIQAMLQYLAKLYQTTSKKIILCIEMEPDCVLESTENLLHYFQQHVQGKMLHCEFLGICFDVCHQAVMFEDIKLSLTKIIAAGIRIGKIQLSNALQVNLNTPNTQQTLQYLHEFSEPKYLHQVKAINSNQQLQSSTDLTAALLALKKSSNDTLPLTSLWRIHFHVPLHTETLLHPSLSTTKQALYDVFDFLQQHKNVKPYLEVETYSWQVLPESLRPMNNAQLIDGIVSELNWVQNELQKRNLLTEM
ncbi:FIG00960890: hypothetical protein [hydrothermal vent metagenome]|uniref:Xylose isomerase-like TIM barrel domain-containing protein n=1 Tax=hydrothermal vent metagenome TaxID=652676 RepID=A0A3B0WPL2_9ZZZZ